MKTETIIMLEEHARNQVIRQSKINVQKWGYQDHPPSTWHQIIQQQTGQLVDAMFKLQESQTLNGARKAEQDYERELIHIAAACMNALTESYMSREERKSLRGPVSRDAQAQK